MTPEKKFENKVRDFVKACNCWFLKTWGNGVQRSGVPDLLICCKSYFVGVELKADNGKPTKLQLHNIDKIRKAGGIGIILYPDDFELFKEFIFLVQQNAPNTLIKQEEFDHEERW